MISADINKIECNLHYLLNMTDAYKRIVDDLTDYFSIKKINFLILIHGYNRGIYFQESVRSPRFVKQMETKYGYKLIRYEKFENKGFSKEPNDGITAFYIDNIKNPSRKLFMATEETEEDKPKNGKQIKIKKEVNAKRINDEKITPDPISTPPIPGEINNTMQKDTAILEKEVKQAIIETTLPETSVPQQKVESSLSGISPESPIKEVKTVDNLEGPPQVQLILTAITNLSLMIEKVNENLNLQNVLLKELISKDHYNPKLNIELNAHPKDQDQSLQLSKSIISKEIPSEKSNEVQNTDKSNISPEPKKTGFMCEICGEYFNSLELRIRHAQKERHLVTGAYECKKCDKKFTLELQYDQHCMSKKH